MKKISKIIGSVLITAAAVCLGIGVYQFTKEQNAGKGYQDLSEEVKKEPEDEGSKSKVDIPIDFAALKEKNPDVYAWISIPGTAIDYPVLQRENDNTYYLDHTIDHEEKTEGAIFTENYNNTDFEDPNTVIYGHDMRNGSMFKGLLDYRDKTFFDQNKEVLIYTPDAIRHYKIFAAYPYDSRHLLRSFDFTDKEVYQQYLYRIFAIRDMNASIDTTAQVGTDDKILTLSTCYANQPDMRFLAQLVADMKELLKAEGAAGLKMTEEQVDALAADLGSRTFVTKFFDLEPVNGGIKDDNGDYLVTLSVPAISTAMTEVAFLHFSTDRAAWEVVEASDVDYTNKEITASFKDLSPVAVIAKVDTSADNAIGTSPQTGRFPVSVLWIGAAVILGTTGVIVLRKRKEK